MKIDYEKSLMTALERAKLSNLQAQAVLVGYKTEAARTNEARAFVEAVEAYGNEDGFLLLQSFAGKSKIEEGLEKLSTQHPGIIDSPQERIKRSIERIKKNRNALEWRIVLDDKERARLTSHQLEALEKAELERRRA
jgi:hypothetical protein